MATTAVRLSGLEKDVAQLQEVVESLQDTNWQILGLVGNIVDLANQTAGVQRQLIGRFDKLDAKVDSAESRLKKDMREFNRIQMESLTRIENLSRSPNH